jgi:hypothetical protein
LWVPLVVAILGLIGTVSGAIAGVVITQRGQMLATVRRGSVSARTMGSRRCRPARSTFGARRI